MITPLFSNFGFGTGSVEGQFSVKSYGAIGDGTTDDTAAFAATIAAAGANSEIIIPRGSYKITSPLSVSNSRVKFVGVGDPTITGANDTQYRKFVVTGSAVEFFGIIFDGLYSSATTGIGAGALEFSGSCDLVKIQRCVFKNNAKQGIYIVGNCGRFVIAENTFTNNFCDIFADDDTTYQPRYLTITDNEFYTGISSAGYAAFSGAIKISGTGSANSIACHVIRGNKIRNSGEMGIEIQTYVNDCIIDSNSVAGTKWGISVSGCYRAAVTGNSVKACTYMGIEIASSCYACSVTGNNVDGRNTSGTVVTTWGIAVVSSSQGVSITGGNVGYCGGEILLQDCSYCKVAGVNLECYQVGLTIKQTQHTHIGDNLFKSSATTPNYFIFFDCSSANCLHTSVNNNTFCGNINYTGCYFYGTGSYVNALIQLRGNRWYGVAGSTFFGWNYEPSRLFIDGTNMGEGRDWSGYTTTSFGVPIWYTNSNFTTNPHHWGAIVVDASGGAKTITLETAVEKCWRRITVIKSDSSGNAVTVNTTSSQTINGTSSYSLASQWKRATFQSDGANWIVVEGN